MLDVNFIRENPEKVKKGISVKNFSPDLVDKVLELDEKRRKYLADFEELRHQRNEAAQGKNIEEGKRVKKALSEIEPKLKESEDLYNEALNAIPNLPLDNVPIGKGEEENKEIKKWGTPRKFDFKPKDHLELGKSLGILDFETGAKVTGSQFFFLYGDGALLELALTRYAFEKLSKVGFQPVITPDLAKSRYYLGTGYAPRGNEAQTFEIGRAHV